MRNIFFILVVAFSWSTTLYADGGYGFPLLLAQLEVLKFAKTSCEISEPASTPQNNLALDLLLNNNSELLKWYEPSKLGLPVPTKHEELLKAELTKFPVKCSDIPNRLNELSPALGFAWSNFKEEVKAHKAWPGLWNDPFFK